MRDEPLLSRQPLSVVPHATPTNPSFAVVVLNLNDAPETMRCVEALERTEPPPDHVVVVDNGSGDDSVNRLEEWADEHWIWRVSGRMSDGNDPKKKTPWLVIARAGVNRGFAGGNNVGIRYLQQRSGVSHFLLLRNIATLGRDFFAEITRAIGRDPRAGLLSGTVFEDADGERVWYAGGVEDSFRARTQHRHDVPDSGDPVRTDFARSCAMVVSRELVERIGPLAECYFPADWEDREYSFRARQAGFPVLYVPRALVYSKVIPTAESGEGELTLDRSWNRLRVFYVRRNYRGLSKGAALVYLAIMKPGHALLETVKGRPRTAWAILSGTIAGFVSSAAHDSTGRG